MSGGWINKDRIEDLSETKGLFIGRIAALFILTITGPEYIIYNGRWIMENNNHKVTIDNRVKTTITEIEEIDSFDEEEIRATLKHGAIIIKGEKLNIQMLDLQEGCAVIGGTINSLMYVKVREKGEKGLLAKIMK